MRMGYYAAAAIFAALSFMPQAHAEEGRSEDRRKQRFEMVTLYQMMEALDLDRATSEKLLESRRKFVEKKKPLQKSMREDLNALRRILQEPNNTQDKELAVLLDSIREKRKKMFELRDQQYDDVAQFLNVRQRAELTLFLRDLMVDMRPHGSDRRFGKHGGPPAGPHSRGPGEGQGPPPMPPDDDFGE